MKPVTRPLSLMNPTLRQLPGRATAALVGISIRHAWLVLLLAALGTWGALTYTAGHLAIDTDTANMLDPELPHRQAHRRFRAAFPAQTGDVLVFTEAASAGAADDAADALAAALAGRPDIAKTVERPGAGEFFATHGLLYLDTDELWSLDERLQSAEPFLGTLAHDPSLRGIFATLGKGLDSELDEAQQDMLKRMFDRVSEATERLMAGDARPVRWRDELFKKDDAKKLHRAFVLVDPALADRDFQPELPGIDALRTLLATLAKEHPEARFRLTGSAVMDAEELETVADDAKLTTVLSFALVAVVLAVGLRSPTLVTGVLVTLACGLIWTAAFATAAVGALNIISVCFAVLFIGMGVDFGIQFTMRYLEQTDRGMARAEALIAAAEGAGGALALAAVGAAICFFVFVPTSYLGLAQLGIISGWSMVIAWFANLTVLPALLRFLPVPARRGRTAVTGVGQAWVQRHHRGVLWVSGALVIGSLCALPYLRFDLNPLNLKDGATDGVAAFRDLASDPDSSPYPIQVLAPSLDEAVALATQLTALPEVDKAITLASYIPAAQDEKLEIISGMNLALADALSLQEDTAPVAITDEAMAFSRFQATLAQAQGRVAPGSAFGKSLSRLDSALRAVDAAPDSLDDTLPALRRQLVGDLAPTLHKLAQLLEAGEVSLDTLPEDLRERWVAADGQARIQVTPGLDLNSPGALQSFAEAVQSVAPSATEAPVELHEGARAVIRACISASLWALLLTILLHHLVLHGLRDALLVAAPLVVAMLLTVATSVVFSVPFNFANIIALPLLIGLNNAYGAYLVVRKGHTTDVHSLLASSTPRAILFSGLTAIASFGVLAVSKHPGMAGMGVLISVSLSYAILSALIVLPALMAALDDRGSSYSEP